MISIFQSGQGPQTKLQLRCLRSILLAATMVEAEQKKKVMSSQPCARADETTRLDRDSTETRQNPHDTLRETFLDFIYVAVFIIYMISTGWNHQWSVVLFTIVAHNAQHHRLCFMGIDELDNEDRDL